MSPAFKLQWQQLCDRFGALQIREQALLAAAGVAIVLMLCDQLLWSSFRHSNAARASRIGELQSQQQLLSAEHAVISARLAQDPDAEVRASLDAAKLRMAAQNEQLQLQTAGLIPPAKMATVLREVLQSRNTLTLLELKNEAAVPAFKPEAAATSTETATPVAALYRHGMTLQLRGRYFEIAAYLKALEELDWHFYWQELHYSVTTYPEAEITLKVYTVSDQESWIGA